MRSLRHGDEGGAALIVALIFLAVWGLVIFAVLGFAEVGFETAAGGNDQSERVYASEGAVELVAAALARGADPQALCGSDVDLELNGRSVTVSCSAVFPRASDAVIDLEAEADGTLQLRARLKVDGDGAVPTNWRVVR